jgi:gamma-glutamyl-gamma-aminobutyrate hydrolase PuuD
MKKKFSTVGVISPTDGAERIFTQERGFLTIKITQNVFIPTNKNLFDYLVFCGGSDVSPEYYGQTQHPQTACNPPRDRWEAELFKFYRHVPKVGICRGAQFLCALNGGSLYQDIGKGHNLPHSVTDIDTDKQYRVTSDHHQACIPLPRWKIIAEGRVETAETDKNKFKNVSFPEAFYIPDDGSLCVQFHPEWGMPSCEDYFFELFERYMR